MLTIGIGRSKALQLCVELNGVTQSNLTEEDLAVVLQCECGMLLQYAGRLDLVILSSKHTYLCMVRT